MSEATKAVNASEPQPEAVGEDRRAFLGASEMGAILGVDPYKTALDVYHEKVGDTEPFRGNQHTRRGTMLEAMAVNEWLETQPDVYGQGDVHRPVVNRVNRRFTHPVYPFITGRIDRRVLGAKRILEVKCPSLGSYHRIKRTGLHEGYIVQMQTYLGLTDSVEGIWVVFCADQWEVCAFPVAFDPVLYHQIIDRAASFWLNHVVPRVPPVAAEADAARIEIRRAEGQVPRFDMTADPAFLDAAQLLAEARKLATEASLLEDQAKERLLGVITQPGVYVAPGYRVGYTQMPGRAAFDKKALMAAEPLDGRAVRQVLAEQFAGAPEQYDLALERVVAECPLDLARFEKRGNPYAVLRVSTFSNEARD